MRIGWSLVKIKEVCQIFNGGTPDTSKPQYWGGVNLWITPKDLGKSKGIFVSNTERKITDEGLRNSSANMLPINSVILSSRAPIGHLAINAKPISTNQGCKGLVPNNHILSKYLYYFLYFSKDLLNDLGSGTTFKELSSSKLSEVDIPLPPLAEQERIIAILDQALAAIDIVKTNTEKVLEEVGLVFDSFLSKVLENPTAGWEKKTLGEICKIERGSSPRPIKNFVTTKSDGVNWIKIGDTKYVDRYIYTTKEKITPEGAKKSRLVNVDDFILSNSMSFGKPYIMKTQGYIHDGWFVLRLPSSINKEYFWYLLSSLFVRSQFDQLASGAIVQNVSSDLVKKVILPIPSLHDQEKLVSELDHIKYKIDDLKKLYVEKLIKLDVLKQSILHKAFSGEL